MQSVKQNIVVNYLCQAWVALMGLAFLPLYIKYLGIEAYGLIGLFTAMQAWLTLLDMGMTPTLNREMARFTAGAHSPQSIRDLLRSLEILSFSLAGLIALVVWLASDWLASDWINAENMPLTTIAQAISVMAFVVALRFVEGIYHGSLFGLQRQIWYSSATAILATVRQLGALALIVWVSPTIQTYFFWQALISLLTVAVFASKVHRALPLSPISPRFSREAITKVCKFAAGMIGITFLAILLTQIDKALLSRLLTLEYFGYYTLAGTLAGVLYMIVVPIDNAIYPRMVELSTKKDHAGLIGIYHQSAQLVTILTAPAVMVLSVFAGDVIYMWSGNISLANNTAPILSLLVLGTFLNGLMHVPYQLQLAHGWTKLTIKANVVAVLILIPAVIWIVPLYGAVGAAWIWIILNAGYVLVSIQLMHHRLFPDEKLRWYFFDVFLPIVGALGVILVARQFQPTSYQDRLHWFAFLIFVGSLAVLASTMLSSHFRPRVSVFIGSIFNWRGS